MKTNHKHYPIIALEGLSATGKSTVGKILAKNTNSCYFHCSENNPLEFSRGFFNKLPLPISYIFYLIYFIFSTNNAKKRSKASVVYMDKSTAWIYSHFKAKGLAKGYFKLIPNYLNSNIARVLYFSSDETERKNRINKRVKEKSASKSDIESLALGHKTDKYYREYIANKIIEVYTTGNKPAKIANEIAKKLTPVISGFMEKEESGKIN